MDGCFTANRQCFWNAAWKRGILMLYHIPCFREHDVQKGCRYNLIVDSSVALVCLDTLCWTSLGLTEAGLY